MCEKPAPPQVDRVLHSDSIGIKEIKLGLRQPKSQSAFYAQLPTQLPATHLGSLRATDFGACLIKDWMIMESSVTVPKSELTSLMS